MHLTMYAHIQDSMSYVRATNCTIYFLSEQEVGKEQQEDSKGIYSQDSFIYTAWVFINTINEIAIKERCHNDDKIFCWLEEENIIY